MIYSLLRLNLPLQTRNEDWVHGLSFRFLADMQAAGLPVEDLGAPMDVLWMRLSRKPTDDPEAPLGRASACRPHNSPPGRKKPSRRSASWVARNSSVA